MLTKNFFGIYQENDEGYYSGIQKKQIIQWCGIFIDRITDEVIDRIILSVMSLIIFNLWPDDRSLSPPLPFLLLSYAFFFATNNHPSPHLNINTIQSLVTNSTTTTLSLWRFSTLSICFCLGILIQILLVCTWKTICFSRYHDKKDGWVSF
jgi:hypothetical protein